MISGERTVGVLGRRIHGSHWWLVVALICTALILLVGSTLLFGLFTVSTEQDSPETMRHEDDELVVVVARAPDGAAQYPAYLAAMQRIQEAVGCPVRTRYIACRERMTEELADEDVDLALVHVSDYLRAREDGEFEILVAPMVSGRRQEIGVIVVERASDTRTFDDLAGRRIAVGAGSSLGGYAYLYWLMDGMDRDPESFFSEIYAGESNTTNLRSLFDGSVDAAVVAKSSLSSWEESRYRIISESPSYGMRPLIVRSRLDESLKERIRYALLSDGTGLEDFGPGGITGFRVPDSDEYAFGEVLLRYSEPTATCDPEDDDE